MRSEQKSELIFYLHFGKITLIAEWKIDYDKAKQETIQEAIATVWVRNDLG